MIEQPTGNAMEQKNWFMMNIFVENEMTRNGEYIYEDHHKKLRIYSFAYA